ncbi:hypothetical protein ACSSS7_008200 [Eimeria intestinalis]
MSCGVSAAAAAAAAAASEAGAAKTAASKPKQTCVSVLTSSLRRTGLGLLLPRCWGVEGCPVSVRGRSVLTSTNAEKENFFFFEHKERHTSQQQQTRSEGGPAGFPGLVGGSPPEGFAASPPSSSCCSSSCRMRFVSTPQPSHCSAAAAQQQQQQLAGAQQASLGMERGCPTPPPVGIRENLSAVCKEGRVRVYDHLANGAAGPPPEPASLAEVQLLQAQASGCPPPPTHP